MSYEDPITLAAEQKQKTLKEISAMRRDTTRQVTAADLQAFLEKQAGRMNPGRGAGADAGGGGAKSFNVNEFGANALRDSALNLQKVFAQAGTNALFQYAVVPGLSSLYGAVKGAIIDDPKRKAIFDTLLRTDPVISQVALRGPDGVKMLQEAYATMARFGPSLTLDVNAVRAFLREAVVTDGAINYATIGNLAQVERSITGNNGERR